MALPASWPPRPSSGRRSIRFYKTGTATGAFADNTFMFAEATSANTYAPTPYVAPGGEQTAAAVGDLTAPGSPMGAGTGSHDADPDPRAPVLAPPYPQIWAFGIRIVNVTGNALEISFDGTNVQGIVPGNTSVIYLHRHESGIAIRGNGAFHVEAW